MCCHYWRSRCYLTPAQRMILLSSSAKPSCVPIQPIASHSRMMVLFVVVAAAATVVVVVLFCFFSIVKSGWNFRGGKCRTQQKFCIWIVGSFVCSFVRSFIDSFVEQSVHTHCSSVAMTLGRVQCEENCLVVWWSHFYWFSIFSKDLCFMNAFSLFLLFFVVPPQIAIRIHIFFSSLLAFVELLLANCSKQQN